MTLKILVVDDEPDVPLLIRQRFRKQIQEKHLEFRFAANGVEALATLEAEPDVDVVLSDINMPEMDGLTLLGKVTDRGPMPKTVMVSAYGDMDNIRTAMNRGAFDFVTKPIDFNDLQATLDKTRSELAMLKQALRTRDELVGLHRELEIGASIQRALLPKGPPPGVPEGRVGIFGTVVPATEVGGDFYDYSMIDDHRLGFVVADVSGKGVGAAIYMAVSCTLLLAAAHEGAPDAGACVARLNELLCLAADTGMFVTVCYGILDLDTGAVDYATAGHPPPFLISASGVRALPKAAGSVVGMMDDLEFGGLKATMAPGDALVLYSDGVNEAMNASREEFTIARTGEFLGTLPAGPAEDIASALVAEVQRHAGGAPQADDITVLVLRYNGAGR
ncbi:MAG: PP2C family protein-serine/threonine phosphatase [Vicinamibacterales bacterium]